jgi:hypothetical protein
VPVEGHARRLATPLRPLDRRFLVAVACAAVAGIGASAYAYSGRSSAPAGEGCIVVTTASTLGSADIRTCGAAARRLCLEQGRSNPQIASACRREGLEVAPVTNSTGLVGR